jgi:hypothetical protein
VTANKQALLRFMGDFIVQKHGQLFRSIFDSDELYIADPLFVKRISSTWVTECKDPYCSHEEADTRMIFHATYADKQFGMKQVKGRIITKSPDTDVLVLAVHFFPWFQTGSITSTRDGRRFIPVHEIVNSLNPVFCHILPAAHALWGCETTSSMFGIGKTTVYKVLKSKSEEFSDLVLLGEGNVEDSLPVSREFVASLYDQKAKLRADYSNLNKFRVRLATKKKQAWPSYHHAKGHSISMY